MMPRWFLLLVCLLAAITPAPGAPGDVDALDANLAGNYVAATVVQPDGKIIIAGSFTSVQGVPRSNVARLNPDGTLDTGFNPSPNGGVSCVAVQPDGRVILGGGFTALQPNGAVSATGRQKIARVNTDGTLDTDFDPTANGEVSCVAVQADGRVLLGGGFTTLQPNGATATSSRRYIARLNFDGTLDTGFNPTANNVVDSVVVQADEKVLLGGNFTTLQPNGASTTTTRNHIARVEADGTLDAGFDPSADRRVSCVAVQADGKVLLGGIFTTLQPNGAATATARQRIARVSADGTLDTGFDPKADYDVLSVVVQADGKVLVGGAFFLLQPNGAPTATQRYSVARLNADGTLDTGFDTRAGGVVLSLAMQADGKVLLGGYFTSLQPNGAASPTTRNRFARIVNDDATQMLSAPDATQVFWQFGGAAPGMSRVTFELSTNGGANWAALGPGTRVGATPNWQLTGLSLPAGGLLRARGVTTGGYRNGSSGLVEAVAPFTTQTAQEVWRLTYFGITTNTGNAADIADPDGDGNNNLFEFVAGLVPNDPASRFHLRIDEVPGQQGQKAIIFRPVLAGRTYVVKTKVALNDPEWTTLPNFTTSDDGDERTVIDLDGTAATRFYRVEITRP